MFMLIPLALSHPFRAFLLWAWTALIGLNFYVYGFMAVVPFNLIFAVISITLIFLGKDNEKGSFVLSRTMVLLIIFLAQATLSTIFSYPNLARNWEIYIDLVKAVTICFFMPIMLTSRYRIHVFVLAIALALVFHGLLEGLKTIVTGGGHHILGVAKFGDNNHFAVVMSMAIPLVLYLFQHLSNRLAKITCIGMIALLVAAVIGTHSRGGLLCLTAMGTWLVLTSRQKRVGIFAMAIGFSVVVALAPSSWWDRMDTIETAGSDLSFMGRVVAWKISSAIALENPFLGGGFHAIENQPVWDRFRDSQGFLGFLTTPAPDTHFHAAHSIYFEILGDLGIVGALIFMAILINVFVTRFEIRKLIVANDRNQLWVCDLADVIAACFVAYMIGGSAVSMAYFELIFAFALLMEILKFHAKLIGTEKIATV
jgi:probable O-glycosylation ligase (exosortase A-associated)